MLLDHPGLTRTLLNVVRSASPPRPERGILGDLFRLCSNLGGGSQAYVAPHPLSLQSQPLSP